MVSGIIGGRDDLPRHGIFIESMRMKRKNRKVTPSALRPLFDEDLLVYLVFVTLLALTTPTFFSRH